MNKLRSCIVIIFLFTTITFAQAVELEFSGFASIRGGQTLDHEKTLNGYDGDFSLKPESIFALQADADLQHGLSATVQFIARSKDDSDVTAEWYYLSYNVTDYAKIAVGRVVIPLYLHSQYVDVGYTYPWLTPPELVYVTQFFAAEGINASYTTEFLGNWENRYEFFYGSNNDVVTFGTVTDNQDISKALAISSTISNEWLTLRAAYAQANVTVKTSLNSLETSVAAVDAEASQNISVDGFLIKFYALGISSDINNWLIDSEYVKLAAAEINGFYKYADRFYLSFGKRIEKFTPYYIYQVERRYAFRSPITGNSALDATLNTTFKAGARDYITHSIGLRYDFHPSTALTFEYKQQKDELNNNDSLNVDILRFSIDTVF